jgi:hypothetical protein
MRKICLTVLILATIFLLIACDYAYVTDIYDPQEYEFEQIMSEQIGSLEFMHGIFVHGDRIFYYYYIVTPNLVSATDMQREVVVVSVLYGGTDRREISVMLPYQIHFIFDGRITADGNIALILNYSAHDGANWERRTSYIEIDEYGEILRFSEIKNEIAESVNIGQALVGLFAQNGEIILYIPADIEVMPSVVRVDGTLSVVEYIHIYSIHALFQTNDGRIFYREWGSMNLREIDFSSGTVSEPTRHVALERTSVISASSYSRYSFYINDITYLLGYNVDTKTATQLINWADVGLDNQALRIDFFQDGRIAIIAIGLEDLITLSLYVFTPITQS